VVLDHQPFSIDGQIAEPGLFAYCASKGAVTFSQVSRALLRPEGLQDQDQSVHPGYITTALNEEEARGYGMEPCRVHGKGRKQHPRPDRDTRDIANVDLFLPRRNPRGQRGLSHDRRGLDRAVDGQTDPTGPGQQT
jgi:NAD(P)-dependent dehydrogenase (short-subunit alcohol dehydrogenase family)